MDHVIRSRKVLRGWDQVLQEAEEEGEIPPGGLRKSFLGKVATE